MKFFNDAKLSLKLYSDIEAGKIDDAIDLLISKLKQLSKQEAAENICNGYIQSSNPKNWEMFWDAVLQNHNKISNAFIVQAIILSQKKHIPSFLLPALNFTTFNYLIKNRVLGNLFIEDKGGMDYLRVLLQAIEDQPDNIKLNFYSLLIQKSFQTKNIAMLQYLNTLEAPFNLTGCIKQFSLEQLMEISEHIVLKKIDSDFVIHLLNDMHSQNNKLLFCKELIMRSVKENNAELIRQLFKHNDSTAFIEIINTLAKNEKELFFHLLIVNQSADIKLIKDISDQLHPDDILEFYNKLVVDSFANYNITLLQKLSFLTTPYDFHAATNDLDQKKLNQLLNFDERQSTYIQTKMNAFSKGYGSIKYEDALLTLAQRRERKKYNFEPVLIRDNELDDFLETLSYSNKPIRQLFVCSGFHFVSGEILIESNGNAKIFLIDSLGTKDGVLYDNFLADFALKFPEHEIFISKESRQKAPKGCSIFALDDIAHLANLRIENHENIWDYLASEKKPKNTIKLETNTSVVTVYEVPLPLSLMRTMQSTSLLDEVIPLKPENVQNFPINKKNQTTEDSVRPFFQKTTPEDEKPRNTRLDYKLSRMKEQNWGFLARHTEREVEEATQHFTLDSFKERINQNKSQTVSENIRKTQDTREQLMEFRQKTNPDARADADPEISGQMLLPKYHQ